MNTEYVRRALPQQCCRFFLRPTGHQAVRPRPSGALLLEQDGSLLSVPYKLALSLCIRALDGDSTEK